MEPPPRSFISPLYYLLVFYSQTLYNVCATLVIDWYLVPEIYESKEIAVFPMSTMDSMQIDGTYT